MNHLVDEIIDRLNPGFKIHYKNGKINILYKGKGCAQIIQNKVITKNKTYEITPVNITEATDDINLCAQNK